MSLDLHRPPVQVQQYSICTFYAAGRTRVPVMYPLLPISKHNGGVLHSLFVLPHPIFSLESPKVVVVSGRLVFLLLFLLLVCLSVLAPNCPWGKGGEGREEYSIYVLWQDKKVRAEGESRRGRANLWKEGRMEKGKVEEEE